MYQIETKFAKTKFRLLFYTSITETAEKIASLSPGQSQTGPAIRNDEKNNCGASSLPYGRK
jgi:hypothetical protein